MTLSILVPVAHTEKVLKRLGKIAKTAGIAIEPIQGTTFLQEEERVIECARYTVGDMPRSNGYTFAARIQHEDGGNIVARAPGEKEDLDVALRTVKNHCAHCGTKRGRKETFMVRTPEGELIQIGRNCLADFMMTSPAAIVAAAEFVRELGSIRDEDEYWGSGSSWEVSPLRYIACAISSVERYGFIKSTEGGYQNEPTRDTAAFIASPKPWGESAAIWMELQPTEAHAAKAKLVLEWCQNIDPSVKSEYLWNLHIASKQKGTGKNQGLLASAPSSYDRELGKQAEAKQAGIAKGFVQAEGEVWKGNATLTGRNVIESDYGSKAICTFRTDDGHVVVWFATGKCPTEIGSRFELKGRVKKCNTYKGVDQTVIARASFKALA